VVIGSVDRRVWQLPACRGVGDTEATSFEPCQSLLFDDHRSLSTASQSSCPQRYGGGEPPNLVLLGLAARRFVTEPHVVQGLRGWTRIRSAPGLQGTFANIRLTACLPGLARMPAMIGQSVINIRIRRRYRPSTSQQAAVLLIPCDPH